MIGVISHGSAAALDARFASDGRGKWASQATASSQYGFDRYSAAHATGVPNVPQYSDHANAWTPGTADGGEERLTLSFAQPMLATEVRVRQSFGPGALTGVELVGSGGERQTVFEGVDPGPYEAGTIAWFVVQFPATPFAVHSVVLRLDTKRVPGWNEIDAVQLVGEPAQR